MKHAERTCLCLYLVVVFRCSCAPLPRSHGGNAVRHRDICAGLRNENSLPNGSCEAAYTSLYRHANLNVGLDFTFNISVVTVPAGHKE